MIEKTILFFILEKTDSARALFLPLKFRKTVNVAHLIRFPQQFAKRCHLSIDGCVAVASSAQFADKPVDLVLRESKSEERRVGKECVSTCRSRWSTSHYKKKTTK